MKRRRRKQRGLFGLNPACQTDNPSYIDDLSALWSLKVLHELRGIKGLLGFPDNLTADGTIMHTIGLGDLEGKEIKLPKFQQKLGEKISEYSELKPDIEGSLSSNIGELAELVGLSPVDQQLLVFTVILHSHRGLEETADTLGDMTLERVAKVLAHLLQIDLKVVSEALSLKSVLARTGLLSIDRTCTQTLKRKLDLPAGFVDAMFESHSDVLSLLSQFFTKSGEKVLSTGDFEYLKDEYTIMHDVLLSARKKSCKGVNILLYGPPGTGKTQLARVLADAIGADGFEISYQDEDNNSVDDLDRLKSFQLSQFALEKKKNALLIFDEIEDVFTSPELFSSVNTNKPGKARTNRLLEENPVPAIWISNEIGQIDPAFLRRFSFALKLDIPPRIVREKILNQHFKTAEIDQDWIHRISLDSRITPAMAAASSKVVTAIGDHAGISNEKILERVLGNSLTALGHVEPLKKESNGALTYRFQALNPDRDIAQILKGLNHCQQIRLCLYGPPGTGKTEFGHYIAKNLDKPLLVKRASDLLDPYVGVAEQNIAAMFKEASRDDAVLLLDEADSFLRDRRAARQSWEVTQVNELLTQMEAYEGLFICSTNLVDDLDEASIRRFDFKIKLDYLEPEQSWVLFRQTIKDSGGVLSKGRNPWKVKLSQFNNLTPGDFALVLRQNRLSAIPLTNEFLYEALSKESEFKEGGRHHGIGFNATL